MLADKIKNREDGIVLYGIVPPKQKTAAEQVQEIAARQIQRLAPLDIDGLILYDIQDESARTSEQRPFPFIDTLDAFSYSEQHLAPLTMPRIIYRSVGKYSEPELSKFLGSTCREKHLAVFVGAASRDQQVTMSVQDAYALKRQLNNALPLGGVVIPERHIEKGDEHIRVFEKIAQGCSFFVSQGVYDVEASKQFLSDYGRYGQEHDITLAPIIFTFTPCGSTKTLQFMKWLGISVPQWLDNELTQSNDILHRSIDACEKIWQELKVFAAQKHIPIGCNIESVAIRKAEVEASIELLQKMSKT